MFIAKLMQFQEVYISSSKMFFSEHWVLAALLLIYLIICTVTDIRSMKIYTQVSMAFVAIRLVLCFIYPLHWSNFGGALFLTGFVFMIAFITFTNMGGDIKAMIPIGLFLGFTNSVVFILISIGILILVGIIVWLKTKDKKAEMPFAPMLLGSYLSMFVIYLI